MSSDHLDRARSTGVAAWVWLAVGGAVTLALGLVSLLAPGATLTVLAVVLSLWLIATGLGRVGLAVAVTTSPTARRALQGVLGVGLALAGLAGLLGLWNSLTLVTLVVAIGFLVAGAADLAMAATGPRGVGRFATGSLGVLHLLVGLVFLLLPEVGLTVLAVLVGVVLVGLGLVQLGAAALVRALVRQTEALRRRMEETGGPGPDDGDGPRVIRGEVL
ncbi:DUF308 domain-containing protein [Aquipuribacter sp. MA13-6]|uniref:DUF308 domain-containing protein n=1 Tax=unclassified Aquipuribacter TaxID=2635084 RepID=UPI003EE9639B